MDIDEIGVYFTAGLAAGAASQVTMQFLAYITRMERRKINLLVTGAGRLTFEIDPLVADPHIMNSSLMVVNFLEQRPELVRGKVITDMGTGSGILGIVAARLGAKKVYMPEINQKAVACAKRNIWRNKVWRRCDVFQSDLFARYGRRELSNVHIFNHPFFAIEPPSIPGNEWLWMMLGGTELLGQYFATASQYAHPDSLYILPWFTLAGNDELDNDPGKRGPEHGFEVIEQVKMQWMGTGLQCSDFYMYVLQKKR